MGIGERGTLERALEQRFPWASDAQIREAAALVSERLRSRNFSKGFTADLRRDAEDMGDLVARIVGPAPTSPGRARRLLSSLENRAAEKVESWLEDRASVAELHRLGARRNKDSYGVKGPDSNYRLKALLILRLHRLLVRVWGSSSDEKER